MTILRLLAVLGVSEAQPTPIAEPRLWFKTPGVYVESTRDGNVYYVVPEVGSPRRVEQEEAERTARAELSPLQQAASEALRAEQARDAARRSGFEASPLHDIRFPTALDCLNQFGAEFEVFAEQDHRKDGTPVPGWRNIIRRDTNVTLHCATDAYEIVPQSVALSLLDKLARQGQQGIVYRYAWASKENMRVRAPGAEKGENVEIVGRRVGIRFDVPTVETQAFAGRVSAGGTLMTSHDGSTAIKATACLTFGGVTIFHVDVRSWRHSSQVALRLTQSKEAFTYLVRAARGLVRDAEATVNVPDDEAADVVLRALAPELFEADPVIGSMPDADRLAKIKQKADKLASSRQRLHARAQLLTSQNPDVFLGGFRYVLAAPHFASNRAVSEASYYDGLARKRMTAALVALARHAGMVEAGIVPAGVVAIPAVLTAPVAEVETAAETVATSQGTVTLTTIAEPETAEPETDAAEVTPSPDACAECGGTGIGDDGFACTRCNGVSAAAGGAS